MAIEKHDQCIVWCEGSMHWVNATTDPPTTLRVLARLAQPTLTASVNGLAVETCFDFRLPVMFPFVPHRLIKPAACEVSSQTTHRIARRYVFPSQFSDMYLSRRLTALLAALAEAASFFSHPPPLFTLPSILVFLFSFFLLIDLLLLFVHTLLPTVVYPSLC